MSVIQEKKSSNFTCLSCAKTFYEFETIKHSLFRFHTRYVDKDGTLYTFSFNVGYCKSLIKKCFGVPKRGFYQIFETTRKIIKLFKKNNN